MRMRHRMIKTLHLGASGTQFALQRLLPLQSRCTLPSPVGSPRTLLTLCLKMAVRRSLSLTPPTPCIEFFGIHDAALGVLAYLGDSILRFAGSTRRWQYRPWLVTLPGIDVIPLGIVSVVLVLCQTIVVGSWYSLCLITATVSLHLVYWAWDEVRASLRYLRIA